MAIIKQSTTYTRVFLLVQSADHVSGLTGASPTVSLSKAGGSFAAAGGTITEIANGFYKIALTATDTGTLGDLAFHCTAASADPTDFIDQVAANILGDTLPANVAQWNGSAVAAPASAGIPDVNLKNIGGSAVNTGAAQLGVNVVGYAAGEDPATLVLDVAASSHNTASTVGAKINAAGSAGDPWSSALPGSYAAGTAGNILGNIVGTLLDAADAIETGVTPRQALRYIAAALAGVLSGAATTTVAISAIGNAGTPRISATVDASGNRSAIALS